jgi:hypothetical protein
LATGTAAGGPGAVTVGHGHAASVRRADRGAPPSHWQAPSPTRRSPLALHRVTGQTPLQAPSGPGPAPCASPPRRPRGCGAYSPGRDAHWQVDTECHRAGSPSPSPHMRQKRTGQGRSARTRTRGTFAGHLPDWIAKLGRLWQPTPSRTAHATPSRFSHAEEQPSLTPLIVAHAPSPDGHERPHTRVHTDHRRVARVVVTQCSVVTWLVRVTWVCERPGCPQEAMRCRHVLDRLNVAAPCNAAQRDRTARKRAARHTAMLPKKSRRWSPRASGLRLRETDA